MRGTEALIASIELNEQHGAQCKCLGSDLAAVGRHLGVHLPTTCLGLLVRAAAPERRIEPLVRLLELLSTRLKLFVRRRQAQREHIAIKGLPLQSRLSPRRRPLRLG